MGAQNQPTLATSLRTTFPRDLRQKLLDSADSVVELASISLQMSQRPNPVQMGAIALSAVRAGMQLYSIWRAPLSLADYIPGAEWYFSEEPQLNHVISYMTAHAPVTLNGYGVCTLYEHSNGGRVIHMPESDGCKFAYDTSTVGALRDMLHDHLRRQLSGPLYVWEENQFIPSAEPVGLVRHGVLDRLIERCRPAYERGSPRSYMLLGEPGVGKSTLAYQVGRALGVSVAVASHQDLMDSATPAHITSTRRVLDSDSVEGFLRLWRPTVAVINDIDYSGRPDALLPILERLHEVVPILFVTVNHPERLPAAVRRPRRIDEFFEVRGLTVDGIRAMLPMLSEAQASRIDGWPAAYVADLGERLKDFGLAAFEAEYLALSARLRAQRMEAPSDS